MNNELLREKLQKVLALAESGSAGEADNARRMLHLLLQKYGLSLDDLTDTAEQEYTFTYTTAAEKHLFVQIYCMVTDKNGCSYRRHGQKREFILSLSPAQYGEIKYLYCVFRAEMTAGIKKMKQQIEEMKKQIDMFADAFCIRNNIFSSHMRGKESKSLSVEELERLRYLVAVAPIVNVRKAINS